MTNFTEITDFLAFLGDAILIANDSSEIVFANQACSNLFGYEQDQIQKLRIDDLMVKSDQFHHQEFVTKYIRSNSAAKDMMARAAIPCINSMGEEFSARISIASVEIGGELFGVATIQDYTLIQKTISILKSKSNVDVLTNLFNRRYLNEVLKPNSRILSTWETVGVLYLDLNKFKPVNDTLGHGAGDEILKVVANRLKASIRFNDILFRVGGDEFLILLNLMDVPDKFEILQLISSKICETISDPIMVQDHAIDIGISIGVGIYPDHSDDLNNLINLTDKAMYLSKSGDDPVGYVYQLDDE